MVQRFLYFWNNRIYCVQFVKVWDVFLVTFVKTFSKHPFCMGSMLDVCFAHGDILTIYLLADVVVSCQIQVFSWGT